MLSGHPPAVPRAIVATLKLNAEPRINRFPETVDHGIYADGHAQCRSESRDGYTGAAE